MASNLIANGDVASGIELILLIGRSLEACKKIIGNDKWEEALLIAKVDNCVQC